jgi:predicted MFS family arabinose efflux permease
VIPGLLGPAAASAIAAAFGWRAVFLALLPLVVIAAAMTAPALDRRPPARSDGPRSHRITGRPRWRW